MMIRTPLIAVLGLALAACGGPSQTGSTLPTGGEEIAVDESLPDEEKVVVLVEGLAQRVSLAGADCAAVSGAIDGWVERYGARTAEMTKQVESTDATVSKADLDELNARLDRSWDTVFSTAKPCGDSATASIERLDAMFGI